MRDKGQGTRDYCLLSERRSNKIHSRTKTPVPCPLSPVPIIFLLILITISCSSLTSEKAETQKPVSFSTIETIQPVWQSFASGVNLFHGKTSSPKLEFYALQINLNTVSIFINEGTASTKVSSFVRDNNLIAGINASPFDVITNKEGEPLKNTGLVVSNYKVHSPLNPNYDALVFYKDMDSTRAIIVSQATIYSTDNIENAVGGFHTILRAGEPAPRTAQTGDTPSNRRHPRTAAGVSANGSVIYWLVIDGRRSGSAGATEHETALLLRALGSYDGINFDGGGSSAMALRQSDGTVKIVNTPGGLGKERAVASCIGIRQKEE